ncbi:Spindle pole body component alp6 [Termitomyces sp. T112]|nr:Spindle pole body component alp6 [Termitomyces sp. T112]
MQKRLIRDYSRARDRMDASGSSITIVHLASHFTAISLSTKMTTLVSSLESLVSSLVPSARGDRVLRDELVSHCRDILTSHIGQNQEPDLGYLSDQAKRHLLQTSPSGSNSLKFTNLLSRLLDQPVLSRKHASVLFLLSLATFTQTQSSASFLPSLAPPPPSRRPTTANPNGHVSPPRTPVSRGKPKAELLKEYRAKNGLSQLSEQLLLRDALYLLQGISGKYIRFSSQEGSEIDNTLVFVDDTKHIISAPTKALIHRLSEVGYLYIRVESYVRETEAAAAVGMIKQSLCYHLQAQLTEYYRLIAILETQMSSSTTWSEDTMSSNPVSHDSGEASVLTLRRLDVWINDWRLRMRMMSVCVEAARDTHGGALVNLIHGYADNGDPFVRKFTDQLLEEVSKPFFATLHKWLFSGELYDPFAEFFVALDQSMTQAQYAHPSPLAGGIVQPSADGAFGGDSEDILGLRESGLRLWETKYQFQKEMLPMFVGEVFGRKIFSTGKSLNFIRYSCHDSDWVITREKMSDTGGILKYSDIAGLERSIDAAYQVASQRLFEVFIGKFRLLDHLSALKNYLLLGHGDFADRLMEALGTSLARPANTLYRHNLTAHLDTALRSSNAIHDPLDVRRRLDARMLEYSHGEIGWDVFTLEYKVDAPIDTVLDPISMETYLKLFRHLWQMKRIEVALNAGWMRTVGGTRNFLRVPELEIEWHKVRIVMTEMIHFIRQMQAHCHLEVIECSWKILNDFLNKKEGDLDALLDAHQSYLDRMAKKVLLLSSKTGKEETILSQVKEIFSTILQYREAVDNFYNYCLTESSRRDQELDVQRGVHTGRARHDETSNPLPGLLERLGEYGSSFTERAQTIVHHLQVHSDLDCRFLGVRLSFSDFYKSKRELAQAQKGGS